MVCSLLSLQHGEFPPRILCKVYHSSRPEDSWRLRTKWVTLTTWPLLISTSSTVEALANSSYDIAGTNNKATTGFYRTRIGNPDAKWETSVTSNIGIDGLFFDGKLDVIVDFWKKETEDLLLQCTNLCGCMVLLHLHHQLTLVTMQNQRDRFVHWAQRVISPNDLGYEVELIW